MKKEFMIVLYHEKEQNTKNLYFFTKEEMEEYLKTRKHGTGYKVMYKFKFKEVR